MGTTPCDRCKRLGRSSQFTNRFRRVSISRTNLNIPDKVSMATVSPDDALVYFGMERIQALEYIVRHYTGLQRYDRQALEDTITGISSSDEVLPQMDENQDDDGSRSEDTASTGRFASQEGILRLTRWKQMQICLTMRFRFIYREIQMME
jgi:hypothetical protein